MSKAGSSGGNNVPHIPRNRFQKSGSDGVYEVTETDTGVVFRIDLPGCPDSSLVYWVVGNRFHFTAEEPALPEYKHDGRKYGGAGTIVYTDNPDGRTNGVKARILNGVLWISIPKVPSSNVDLDVIEMMMSFNI